MNECTHHLAERKTACADGLCPICAVAEIARIRNREQEKRAPVQGYVAGIPWSMHLRAYDAYCKKYGPQKALIDLEGRGCRGGFGVGELDDFIPGWREELSEITALKAEIECLSRGLAEARAALKKCENVEVEYPEGRNGNLHDTGGFWCGVETTLEAIRRLASHNPSDGERR